jgi:hypothetical protein
MHVGSNKITRMQLKLITTHAIQNRVCVALVAIQNLFCPAVRLLCLTCHASWVHISESEVRSQLTVKRRNRSTTTCTRGPLYSSSIRSKILSFIHNSSTPIHPLYHPLSTLSTVGPTYHFI